MSVINTTTLSVVATIASISMHPYYAAYDPTDGWVFVTESDSDTAVAIDATTRAIVSGCGTITNPMGIAYDQVHNYILVADRTSNVVRVVNAATRTVIDQVAIGTNLEYLYVNPEDGYLYAARTKTAGTVSKVDLGTLTVSASLTLQNEPHGVAAAAGQNKLATVNRASDSISLISLPGFTLDGHVACGDGPSNVVWHAGRSRWYVASRFDNRVYIVNLDGSADTLVDVGNGPVGLCYDSVSQRVFCSNTASNTVSVIS